MPSLRIGCSGWNYAHWRDGVFYPPRCASRNWLEFYSRYFDTVAINSTFYHLPRASSVQSSAVACLTLRGYRSAMKRT